MPLIAKNVLSECLKGLIRPIVKLCLKNSLKLQDLSEIAKIVFIEESRNEIIRLGEKVNSSRLSVMSGVHRRDVIRLAAEDFAPKETGNITVKVIGHWQQYYKLNNGTLKKLSYGSDSSEFSIMVREISQDVHPQSVLSELVRTEQVVLKDDHAELKQKVYNPKGDFKKSFNILAQDCNDLIAAVEQNLLSNNKIPNLHMRTEYDSIICEDPEQLKQWFLNKGDKIHEDCRNKLSKMDSDLNPKIKSNEKKLRVAFGTYSWLEESDEK